MIPALSPFTHQTIPPASLMIRIVSGGHFQLAEHNLIEWLPVPTPYSFTRFGAKDDSIEPPNLFTYIGADDTPKGLHATVEGVSKVKLSGGRVVPRHLPFRSNDPKFPRCEHWQKLLILDAIDNAKRILIRAVRDIDWAIAANHVARTNFVTWFGRYSRDNANQVRRNLVGFGRDLDFWRYDIKCGYPNTVPSEICKYTLQLRDRRSVTDKPLDQSPTKGKSGSPNPSGGSWGGADRFSFSAWPLSATQPYLTRNMVQMKLMRWLCRTQDLLSGIWTITWRSFGNIPPLLPTLLLLTTPMVLITLLPIPKVIITLPTMGSGKDRVSDFARLSM